MNKNLPKWLPFAGIAVIAALGALLLRDVLTFEALKENRELLLEFRDSHYGLTALALVGFYIGLVTFSLPGATMATLTGGFLFGVFPGVLFNMLGATIGAIFIFLAARRGIGEKLVAKMEASAGIAHRLKAGIDRNQWEMLFLMRLLPAVPFFVANLIPALVAVPLYRFVITTFFGIMPGALVYTSVGAGLGEVFTRGETPDLGVIFEPQIIAPILGLCLLSVLPIVIKSLRGGKAI